MGDLTNVLEIVDKLDPIIPIQNKAVIMYIKVKCKKYIAMYLWR